MKEKDAAISISYKGMNEMKVILHQLPSNEQTEILSFPRDQGEFPLLHYFKTDTSFIVWHSLREERGQSSAFLLFTEFSIQGEQLSNWQIDLKKPLDLVKVIRCSLVGKQVILLVKEFNRSPVEKRAGRVNYKYSILKSDFGFDQYERFEVSPQKYYSNTPLVRFDGRYCLAISICGKKSVEKQKLLHSTLIDLEGNSVKNSIFELSELNIPKNRFTYRRFSKSHIGLQTTGFINHSEQWTVILESRNIQYLGMDGNRPILSYQFGPVLVLNWQKNLDSITTSVLNKNQFSFDDDAVAISGKFVRDRENLFYFFNDNSSSFLGIPITKRIEHQTHYRIAEFQNDKKPHISEMEISLPRKRLPLWNLAITEDNTLILPVQDKQSISLLIVNWTRL